MNTITDKEVDAIIKECMPTLLRMTKPGEQSIPAGLTFNMEALANMVRFVVRWYTNDDPRLRSSVPGPVLDMTGEQQPRAIPRPAKVEVKYKDGVFFHEPPLKVQQPDPNNDPGPNSDVVELDGHKFPHQPGNPPPTAPGTTPSELPPLPHQIAKAIEGSFPETPVIPIDHHDKAYSMELVCLKCLNRAYHVINARNTLKQLQCKCGETGFLIGTGQPMQ